MLVYFTGQNLESTVDILTLKKHMQNGRFLWYDLCETVECHTYMASTIFSYHMTNIIIHRCIKDNLELN